MVRKYRNTIQYPYTAASAASVSGSLQTALSKVTWPSAPADTRGVSLRVTDHIAGEADGLVLAGLELFARERLGHLQEVDPQSEPGVQEGFRG